MKHDLIKLFGEQRAKSILKYAVKEEEHTIFNSTIFTDLFDDPIYITHVTLPSLNTNYDELKESTFGNESNHTYNNVEDGLLSDFYSEWNPIDYIKLVFTDLQPTKVLGDITMISTRGVFKLTNVSIDDSEKRLFYDDAVLLSDSI